MLPKTIDKLFMRLLEWTRRRIVEVSFTTPLTDTQIEHGLGYVPEHWEIKDQTAEGTIFRDPTGTQWTTKYAYLQSTTNMTAKIMFY